MESVVEIGGYALEPGNDGTKINGSGDGTGAAIEPLQRAFAEPTPPQQAEPALVTEVDEASKTTAKIERAVALCKGVGEGKALDPTQLGLEVGALLDCLERLDRKKEHKKSIQMARALATLLMLLKRWADLLQTLRTALRIGREMGDEGTVAWAKHELGTLRLAAGDVEGADEDLRRAREIRERIGDRGGLAATNRNLQVLCDRLREMLRREELVRAQSGRRPLLRLLPLAVLATLFVAAGVATGLVTGDSDRPGGGAGTEPTSGNDRPDSFPIVVTFAGDGSGRVRGEGEGCTRTCRGEVEAGEELTLVAETEGGSVFAGFSGDCEGTTCTLTATSPISVVATFRSPDEGDPGGDPGEERRTEAEQAEEERTEDEQAEKDRTAEEVLEDERIQTEAAHEVLKKEKGAVPPPPGPAVD